MEQLPRQLLWLADAPLFIDEKQVEAFYDAVLRPDYEEIGKSISKSITKDSTFGGGLNVAAVLPWWPSKAGAEVSGSHTRHQGKEEGSTLARVVNPYRHLLALALQYSAEPKLKGRLVLADKDRCINVAGESVDIGSEAFAQDVPRAIVMLELPSGTPLIPTALELMSGEVVRLYETLAARLQVPGKHSLPDYPTGPEPAATAARKAYWDWFAEFYEKRHVLEVVEEAVHGEPIAWIDFRVPVLDRYVHLHVAARGRYETGVFGYQMISRGFSHGLRIVGSLKCEPDINVLAVFER